MEYARLIIISSLVGVLSQSWLFHSICFRSIIKNIFHPFQESTNKMIETEKTLSTNENK